MANVLVEETYLEEIADAIREKNGLTATYKPDQMATAIRNIKTSTSNVVVSADEVLRAVVDRSITALTEDTITTVGKYAFAYAEDLNNINLSACETIKDYGFYNSGLINIDLPAVYRVGNNAFASCANIESIDLSNAVEFGNYVLSSCSKLKTAKLNSNPETAIAGTLGNYTFAGTTGLELVDFGYINNLGSNPFGYSSSKSHSFPNLILRYNGVVSFSNTGATGLKTGCYIYVPRAQVEKYKASSLWGGWANYIRAIEDYPNICG